jgi:cobalamin biosynthesis protein CobT
LNSIPTATKYARKALNALEQLADDGSSQTENQAQEDETQEDETQEDRNQTEATKAEVIEAEVESQVRSQSEQEDQRSLIDLITPDFSDSPTTNEIEIEFKKLTQSSCINIMNTKLLSYYRSKLPVAKYESIVDICKLKKSVSILMRI